MVRDHILERKPLSDSLLSHLGKGGIEWDQQFYPKKSGFESLQSIGLYTLSNDSVRLAITDLFQLSFTRLEKRGREGDSYRIEKFIMPLLEDHLVLNPRPEVDNSGELIYHRTIRNYEEFLNDGHLAEGLLTLIEIRQRKIRSHNSILAATERVAKMVKDEIERLEG